MKAQVRSRCRGKFTAMPIWFTLVGRVHSSGSSRPLLASIMVALPFKVGPSLVVILGLLRVWWCVRLVRTVVVHPYRMVPDMVVMEMILPLFCTPLRVNLAWGGNSVMPECMNTLVLRLGPLPQQVLQL